MTLLDNYINLFIQTEAVDLDELSIPNIRFSDIGQLFDNDNFEHFMDMVRNNTPDYVLNRMENPSLVNRDNFFDESIASYAVNFWQAIGEYKHFNLRSRYV